MAAGWMLLACFLFGCMGVFVKFGAAYFSHIEMVFYRSLCGLLIAWFILRQQGVSIGSRHWRTHVMRGLSGSVALVMFFYCITVLPLATAVTLNYTSPLFLTVFVTLILKDKFNFFLAFAVALGFAGVVLLLQPSLQQEKLWSGLIGVSSGALAGFAYLKVKQLGMLGEPEVRTVFYFCLIASLASGVWMLFGVVHPLSMQSGAILLGLGVTALLAQLAMTRAYKIGQALMVGSLAYATIIFASIFGMIFWGEMLQPSGLTGMVLIMTGGVISLLRSKKRNAQSREREIL